jgi:6-pyruvoyltetrahydropterin/6-carboxytetrahydropterin synthase
MDAAAPSPPPRYSVRVTKDSLVFSAAHFITYLRDRCERLHGHNYRVEVEVAGPLDENRYVYDFIALRDDTQAICLELDHRVLLPDRNPRIRVAVGPSETTASFENRRWVFPNEDCAVLPVQNTTAELLARWIGGRLVGKWRSAGLPSPERLTVRVEENFGQWAECNLEGLDRLEG